MAKKAERSFTWDELMTVGLWLKKARPTEDREVIDLLASLPFESFKEIQDLYMSGK